MNNLIFEESAKIFFSKQAKTIQLCEFQCCLTLLIYFYPFCLQHIQHKCQSSVQCITGNFIILILDFIQP